MTQDHTSLQNLVLAILAEPKACQLDHLDEDDWQHILEMTRQHRIGPVMYKSLTSQPQNTLPEFAIEVLRKDYQLWTHRALLHQRELFRIHDLLTAADIPYLALKGAYLSFFAYPEAGLRPMRDLDFLIPKDRILQAYDLLIENGFARSEERQGNIEASAINRKHLPPLVSDDTQIYIELHNRIRSERKFGPAKSDFTGEEVWQTPLIKRQGTRDLAFLSATDQLLHLTTHAVYDHELNNGPITLFDIKFLLAVQDIDWTRFWKIAELENATRGCALILRMAQDTWALSNIAYSNDAKTVLAEDVALADKLRPLMLIDISTKQPAKLESHLSGKTTPMQKAMVLWKRLFPGKLAIAQNFPVRHDSPLVYIYYCKHIFRLIFLRMPQLAVLQRNDMFQSDVAHLAKLQKWLQK